MWASRKMSRFDTGSRKRHHRERSIWVEPWSNRRVRRREGEGSEALVRFHCLFTQEWTSMEGEQTAGLLPKDAFPLRRKECGHYISVVKQPCWTSLGVQWLIVHTSTEGGTGSISGQGTKIPHAAWWGQANKSQKGKNNRRSTFQETLLGSLPSIYSFLLSPRNADFVHDTWVAAENMDFPGSLQARD